MDAPEFNRFYKTVDDIWDIDWQRNPSPIRDRAGVYMITPKNKCNVIYVGQGTNLSFRITHSAHSFFNRDTHDFYVFFTDDKDLRGYLEYSAINILRPRHNFRAGQLHCKIPEQALKMAYNSIFK